MESQADCNYLPIRALIPYPPRCAIYVLLLLLLRGTQLWQTPREESRGRREIPALPHTMAAKKGVEIAHESSMALCTALAITRSIRREPVEHDLLCDAASDAAGMESISIYTVYTVSILCILVRERERYT